MWNYKTLLGKCQNLTKSYTSRKKWLEHLERLSENRSRAAAAIWTKRKKIPETISIKIWSFKSCYWNRPRA
jgi:hypothetical protein